MLTVESLLSLALMLAALIAGDFPSVHGQGESCRTPLSEAGSCQILTDCAPLVKILYQQPLSRDSANFLIASQSSCGGRSIDRKPIVCCTESATKTIELPPPSDGESGFDFDANDDAPEPKDSSRCLDPIGRDGFCTELRACPIVVNELQKHTTNSDFSEYLLNSNGICAYAATVVCCPPLATTTRAWEEPVPVPPIIDTPVTVKVPTMGGDSVPHLLTIDEQCGVSRNIKFTKVVGGIEANKGSMPWMALIGYTDTAGEVAWKCGGSLISRRHVLTAAHCIIKTLTTVRLGEHDLLKPAETAFNVPVNKATKYPMYDAKDGHADLAVLQLARDVPFTDAVRPICLPIGDPVRSRNFVGYNPFVAGWGRTTEGGRSSNVLQQLQLPVLENSVCKERYKAVKKLISEKQFDDAVLCAGELDGGKDACQGDSGGPLIQPVTQNGAPNFYQIGIVSYGIGCARADIPGVYTRVQTFVDWIRDRVADELV